MNNDNENGHRDQARVTASSLIELESSQESSARPISIVSAALLSRHAKRMLQDAPMRRGMILSLTNRFDSLDEKAKV